MKNAWKKLVSAVMAIFMIGCSKTTESEIICGGRTDKSDPDAPKVIESTEITEFSVAFFLAERWTGEDDHRFDFEVKPDENGVLTAYEHYSGIQHLADEDLLNALQEVIVQNNLAMMNGIYEVTAGLPPEYQPRILKVKYASGETLSYTVDNDPYEAWAVQICDVFEGWLKQNNISWDLEKWENIGE